LSGAAELEPKHVDLSGAAELEPKHVSEAIQYRSLDRRGLV